MPHGRISLLLPPAPSSLRSSVVLPPPGTLPAAAIDSPLLFPLSAAAALPPPLSTSPCSSLFLLLSMVGRSHVAVPHAAPALPTPTPAPVPRPFPVRGTLRIRSAGASASPGPPGDIARVSWFGSASWPVPPSAVPPTPHPRRFLQLPHPAPSRPAEVCFQRSPAGATAARHPPRFAAVSVQRRMTGPAQPSDARLPVARRGDAALLRVLEPTSPCQHRRV